jgi:hypothetical protein
VIRRPLSGMPSISPITCSTCRLGGRVDRDTLSDSRARYRGDRGSHHNVCDAMSDSDSHSPRMRNSPPRGHHQGDARNPRSRLRAARRALATARQPANRRDLAIRALPARTGKVRRSSPAAHAYSRSRRRVRQQRIVLAQRHRTRLADFVDCLTIPSNARTSKTMTDSRKWALTRDFVWSGRRDSNPRPSPWQGDAFRPWRPLSPVDQALLRRLGRPVRRVPSSPAEIVQRVKQSTKSADDVVDVPEPTDARVVPVVHDCSCPWPDTVVTVTADDGRRVDPRRHFRRARARR